ncbi:flagellar biosynthesis protein FlhA [Desulfurobacterium thermolithotrophum DSM 11699]|uniref:Flagellar biosynthesis protein FlhA n=1 Tax=Desulfurobacterium thermolithotrophum (strain DSM 11699 / BSA) TaxID=868864 RepID=F0S0Q6_DESTD|nr:flagellar biosynthesis protein FlhA [Desulfurobacterium thermolithotrophum]ADY73859.1 flagellar biosynthesis protein FlhA [Desulfurobacterium thermolithotrophum DSM 11699]
MKESLALYYSKFYKYSDVVFIALILSILASMILPVPAIFLDILLTASIAFSLVILMATVYINHPLELSSFPSLLLLATLFRLSLNVATTRRILLHGHEGSDAAGSVIKAFGQFVVGGNYVVGIIVFIILVVINYIVITKGTERISEVAARFTLDAMPGKQMSIDADLNAGLIDEKEAQRRREEIAREADFYGAMDGASKFIRGDAIAGIIITLINIIGGLAIGVLQHHMSFSDAAKTFTLLTVGDGLVSQIPSLITSTAAGLMVTRAAAETDLGHEVFKQLTGYYKALFMAAGAIAIIGIVPGMPTIPFALLAALIAATAYMVYLVDKRKEIEEAERKARELLKQAKESEEKPEEIVVQPEPITLEIGYSLIPYVDESQNGEIVKKIRSLRKQLAKELGIIIPLVHLKDNLELKPNEYRILLRDVEVARGEVQPGKYLAIDTGGTRGKIEGIPTKEPAFGLTAYWIDEKSKDKAKLLGYTVVDIPTVIVTHLSEVIKKHAYEILGRAEVKQLIDNLSKKYPIVKEIIPEQVSLGTLTKVLQNLLREGIPVRDLLSIIESVSDNIDKTRDPEILTEFARQSLSRLISNLYSKDGILTAISLDPETENYILKKVKENDGYLPPLDPVFVQNLVKSISGTLEKFIINQVTPVLLASPAVRRFIKRIIEPYLPSIAVLSYSEIEAGLKVNLIGTVKG